jgi:hypothetical protein
MWDGTMKAALLLLAAALAAAGPLLAQAQIGAGDLTGSVVDAQGNLIRTAQVTATAPERGISRSAQTNDSGEYRIPLLPPGVYTVRVEAAGFTTRVITGATVLVGQALTLNAQLEVGAISTEITVVAVSPVVETERTQQASTIDRQRIEALPINRRNYLDFALLAPGVVETNDLVDSTDYRVAQAPQSGLSFGGGNGRGNNFTIDGAENYLDSGTVRSAISQETVQEFQINRNSFSAESGGAFGGSINIITRSGTNTPHGNLFGFLRQRDLQARNFFDPIKSAFTRGQYGATFGAPIQRDKTFLFLGYERLDRHETSFVPILQDRTAFASLTPSQQQLANFFDSAPAPQLQAYGTLLRRYLIPNNFPATVALFDRNSGNFPFSEDDTMLSTRLDRRFGSRDNFFARGSLNRGTNQNAQLGALAGFNRGRSIATWDASVMLSNTYVMGSRWVSDTRLLYGYDRRRVIPTDTFGPDITISGYGLFGREIFLPSVTFERHYQAQQSFSYTGGRHNLKFGVDVNPVRDVVRSETFFGGRFQFGANIPLGLLLPKLTGDPNAATALANTLVALGQQSLVPALSQPITALQSYSLGLPELYQQGFGDPNWTAWFKRSGFFVQDSLKITPRLLLSLGLRYDIEGEPAPLHTDMNNLAPRVGFSWTPSADSKTVVRGGFGFYYSQINGQVPNLAATLNGTQIAQAAITPLGIPGLVNPTTKQPITSFDVYQTLLAQGVVGQRPITQQDLAQFGLQPGPNAPGRVVFGIVDDYVNPYAQQASLEIERAVGNVALSAAYQFTRGARLPRILDRNLYYTGKTASGQPTFGFYNPSILQDNVEESTAKSFYHSLVFQATKQFSNHFSLNAHYTFSKAIDEVTDFNSDFEPQDQLNARADRGLSSFDQRHRFVFSSLIASPAQNVVFRDFTLSPILDANSGRPFNLLTGFDNFGDRHATNHRPFGAGRNIGRGPRYFSADLRLARRFPFAEGRRSVEVIAEGFNLLNRTNFKSVNSVVGSLSLAQLPSPIVGRAGSPTAPLSFTAAFPARQFQLGLKINF